MLRIIERYLVTVKGEQMLVGCQPGEDPIVKACRQNEKIRESDRIIAMLVDRVTQEIHLYENVKTRDIPKATGRREYEFEYSDRRNQWRDERLG